MWKIHSRVENFLFYFYLSAWFLVVVVFVLFSFSPLFRFLLLTPVNRRNLAELDFTSALHRGRETSDVFSHVIGFISFHSPAFQHQIHSEHKSENRLHGILSLSAPSLDSQSSLSPPAGFPSWDI